IKDHPTAFVICKLLNHDEIYAFNSDYKTWILWSKNHLMNFLNELQIDKSANQDRTLEEFGNVSSLGASKTNYPTDYDPSVLEYFLNKHCDNDYVVSLDAYEFSSLCPKTHQPDFAK